MARQQNQMTAIIGVTEHGNSAVLVTISSDCKLVDRRRVNLTPNNTPTHPYHHEGSWAVGRYKNSPWAKEISLPDAIALIEHVQVLAKDGARKALETLAGDISETIAGILIRECRVLPPSVEETILDNRAQTVADTVMYRQALASAATERGWTVSWYDAAHVIDEAAIVLDCENINSYLTEMGKSVGPPWQAKHKLATAAAIVGLAKGTIKS